MKSFLSKKSQTIALFIILELATIGMGMGVPFFTILLGLPVGWFLPRLLQTPAEISPASLKSLLRMALITSRLSALILAAIWLPALSWLFDPPRTWPTTACRCSCLNP